MTREDIIQMAREAGLDPDLWNFTNAFECFAKLVADKKEAEMQEKIEALHALYEQVKRQRDEVMDQQMQMMLLLREGNTVIFKSCVNLPHWKRTAMRYLKRNAPAMHQQAVNEFNEHPDGRGQQ